MEGSLVNKRDFLALSLSGTFCHRTRRDPVAVFLLDNWLYIDNFKRGIDFVFWSDTLPTAFPNLFFCKYSRIVWKMNLKIWELKRLERDESSIINESTDWHCSMKNCIDYRAILKLQMADLVKKNYLYFYKTLDSICNKFIFQNS